MRVSSAPRKALMASCKPAVEFAGSDGGAIGGAWRKGASGMRAMDGAGAAAEAAGV
ncbi:hypothetical protein D3C72_2082500 [compost metagenome]